MREKDGKEVKRFKGRKINVGEIVLCTERKYNQVDTHTDL
jgi:hypothetical protein